jgi:hypothetical protein
MSSIKFIQLIANTSEPLRRITEDARLAVSRACSGIDDMHLLGGKALVIRSEIFAEQLSDLVVALEAIGISVDRASVPSAASLASHQHYTITLQVTSFSDDTDGRVIIPDVPG